MRSHLSALRDLRAVLRRIEDDFGTVASVIALEDSGLALRAPEISAWSVAEQVDHLVKVEQSIFSHLLTRTPAPGKAISWAGRLVLLTGWIPRGRGTSPRKLRGTTAGPAELGAALEACRETFHRLAAEPDPLLDPVPSLPHKMFGALTAAEALRFVPIHTHHHLKIVADIRTSAGSR
jgi:DinB superfamily